MPKWTYTDLDDDLELPEDYNRIQKIKKGGNREIEEPKKKSGPKRIPRPEKQ